MRNLFFLAILLITSLLVGQKPVYYEIDAIDLTTDSIGDSDIKQLFLFNNQLHFINGGELFRSDGTTASSEGTGVMVFNRSLIINTDEELVFRSGSSLLFTDGTQELEQRYDFFDSAREVTMSAPVKFGEEYYVLVIGVNRFEVADYLRLMRIDLNESVPEVVFELQYDRLVSTTPYLSVSDSTLYFVVPEEDETTGTLYQSDGTTEGTQFYPGDIKFNDIRRIRQQLLSLPNDRMVLFNVESNQEDISAGLYLFPGGGQPGAVLEETPFDVGIKFNRELASYYLLAPAYGPAYRISKADGTIDTILGPELLGDVFIIDLKSNPTQDKLLLLTEDRNNRKQEIRLVNEDLTGYQSIFGLTASGEFIIDAELKWPDLAISVGLVDATRRELNSRIELIDLEEETHQTVLLGDQVGFAGLDDLLFYEDELFFQFKTQTYGNEVHYIQPGVERSIRGKVYEDINANGVRDPEEPGISRYPVMLRGHPRFPLYTNAEGVFEICFLGNDQLVIDTAQGTCWGLTTTPEQYLIDPDSTATTGLDFGFQWQGNTDLEAYLLAGHLRCGEEVPYWLTLRNNGCATRDSVELSIELDERVRFSESEVIPHEVTNEKIIWRVPVLESGTMLSIPFTLSLIASDATGPPLEMRVVAATETLQDVFNYKQALSCTGQDSELTVSPARPDPTNSNFIQVDETLTYSFRWQNTLGRSVNAPGFIDSLKPYLNPSSVKVLSTNRSIEHEVYDSILVFTLETNFEVVDSSIDHQDSYVILEFEAKLDSFTLPGTIVTNSIDMYVDTLPKTTSNTTKNTVVAFLDEDNDGYNFWEDCADTLSAINPTAFDEFGNGIDENCDGVDGTVATRYATLPPISIHPNPTRDRVIVDWLENRPLWVEVFNLTGSLVLSTRLNAGGGINLSKEPPGIYFFRLSDDLGRSSTLRIVKQ